MYNIKNIDIDNTLLIMALKEQNEIRRDMERIRKIKESRQTRRAIRVSKRYLQALMSSLLSAWQAR